MIFIYKTQNIRYKISYIFYNHKLYPIQFPSLYHPILNKSEMSSSLKQRLANVQKQLNNANANLKTYQHEVDVLRAAKDTFQKQFDANNIDIKRNIATELDRIFQQLKRHVNHHKNQNARILQQLAHLNQQKLNFQNFLKSIRDKLEEIERQVGE